MRKITSKCAYWKEGANREQKSYTMTLINHLKHYMHQKTPTLNGTVRKQHSKPNFLGCRTWHNMQGDRNSTKNQSQSPNAVRCHDGSRTEPTPVKQPSPTATIPSPFPSDSSQLLYRAPVLSLSAVLSPSRARRALSPGRSEESRAMSAVLRRIRASQAGQPQAMQAVL